jgi:hypothetical protein
MSKISELANKFAMKLSLEPRPFAMPATNYEHTIEDIEPEIIAPTRLLSERPRTDVEDRLNLIKATLHNLSEQIAMSNYKGTLSLISTATYDLGQLEKLITHKMKPKKDTHK